MKIMREFTFYPSWNSRHFSWESHEDLFPLPEFNKIAKMLNDKGWEIHSFQYFEDDDRGKWEQPNEYMKSLKIYCVKNISKNKNWQEEKYCFKVKNKEGELELL